MNKNKFFGNSEILCSVKVNARIGNDNLVIICLFDCGFDPDRGECTK